MYMNKYFREFRRETRTISGLIWGDLDFGIHSSDEYTLSTLNVERFWKTFNIYSIIEFIHIRHVFVDIFNPLNEPVKKIHTILYKMKTATTNIVHRLNKKKEFHFVHHSKENVSSVCLRSNVCICSTGKFFLLFPDNLLCHLSLWLNTFVSHFGNRIK